LKSFGRPAPDFNQLTDALGERYDICETSIKRHACGGQTHAALDALLAIMEYHGLVAADIESIDAQLAHDALKIVDDKPLLIANVQFVLALGAHVGLIKREHFTPRWTEDADIWRLKERVTVRDNDELSARFPAMKGAIVTVKAKGETFVHSFQTPPGSPLRPLSVSEIKGKFVGLATTVLSDDVAEELWSLLEGFEKLSDTRRFFEILAS
jgi:2-methylcitrate dehydratase PrpD